MSVYINSPFKPPVQLAVAGTPSYLIGGWNDKTGPTFGYVQSNSGATTTGTIVFRIVSGNVPVVGALLTAVGQSNSANFNVTSASILSVSCTSAGICTVTVTITSTTQASTPDGGEVIVAQPEVGETVAAAYKSAPVARPFNNPTINEGQSLSATLKLGAGLSAVTATLEGADLDLDSEYVTIHTFGTSGLSSFQSGQDNIASSATPLAIEANPGGVNQLNWRFYRFNISAVTGSGAVIGKIEF
jgi:hypothetical protein